MTWMVYGAYGYTGRLVTALATERGEMPVLAGRSESRLRQLAEMFQLEHRVLPLDDPDTVRKALEDIDVVAHCAGPFSATALPMVEACLDTATHYLDITGEIDVFEAVLARHDQARDAGVTLLPGAGFDVVPSDCLAALLAAQLPGATHLSLAVRFAGRPSPGTATTAVESMGSPGRARVEGVIGPVPTAWRRRRLPLPDGEMDGTAIAWGDVSTAFHSTGIGNVVVYTGLPRPLRALTSVAPVLAPLLANGSVQSGFKALARRLPAPSAQERERSGTLVWGEARDSSGTTVQGTVRTINPYDVTADSVVRIATSLVTGRVAAGALTPSQAMGPGFVRDLDNVEVRVPR